MLFELLSDEDSELERPYLILRQILNLRQIRMLKLKQRLK
jgi:hypothetical protein